VKSFSFNWFVVLHWTHLELKRYFGIQQLLDEGSAAAIWERANAVLAAGVLRAQDILKKFQVKVLCTTDDPTDDLTHHRKIAGSGLETKVYPASLLSKLAEIQFVPVD
jgi:glucuronate isomerase